MITCINIDNLKFNVNEIFYSIQGEGTRAGRPCVFVRLQGCELRCSWCDTPYALEIKQNAMEMTGTQILNQVLDFDCKYVLFTGGEPLLQKDLLPLLDKFVEMGFETSIETNGHQNIENVNPKVIKIMDFKAPGSGMDKFNRFENLGFLLKSDEIKIVIAGYNDYQWSRNLILEQKLHEKVESVILSPALNVVDYKDLAEWILEDKLPVRMQVQMHKIIWPPDARGV
jgi:7-carboxy-7-deazaguanine synthase